MTVFGWDLSSWDWGRHRVNLADARRSGISFVTHKVTEGCPAAGSAYVDPYFDDFVAQLPHAGFPVAGSYHAAHNGHPKAQADFWFDTVTAKYPGWRKHPCWIWQIDAEPLDGYRAPTKADIVAIGARLEAHGVARAAIVAYAPEWVYRNSLTGIPYRLWASNYTQQARTFKAVYPGDHAAGWDPYSGQTPLILQFSSVTTIGAQHECDANAVRVTSEAALVRLFNPTPTPPPTPVPVPATATRKDPDMIVVRVNENTVPKGKTWPGWFTFDGQNLAHLTKDVAGVDNGAQVLAACGQKAPAAITYEQYVTWGGK